MTQPTDPIREFEHGVIKDYQRWKSEPIFPPLLEDISARAAQLVAKELEKLKLRGGMHNGLTTAQLGGRVFVPEEEVNDRIDTALAPYQALVNEGEK